MKKILKKNSKSLALVTFLVLGCSLANVIHPYILKRLLDLDFKPSNIINKIIIILLGLKSKSNNLFSI